MKTLQKTILFLGLILFSMGCSSEDEEILLIDGINKQKLVDLVNAQRLAGCNCGGTQMPAVSAISWNDKLEEAAKIHSQDMAKNNHFDHTGTDKSKFSDRITRVGYNWQTAGENIAQNPGNEEAVIQSWLESTGHCKNIMNPDFTEMGIAKVDSYWTQVFALPM